MLLNKERAVRLMEENGIDALVASTIENVVYASDFSARTLHGWKNSLVFTVLPRRDIMNSALIIPVVNLFENVNAPSWVKDVLCYGKFPIYVAPKISPGMDADFARALKEAKDYGSAVEALISALKDRGLTKGKIGLDEMRVTPAVWATIQEKLPGCQLVPAYEIFRMVRAVKTEEEIERIAQSTNIAEVAILKSMQACKAGTLESELLQIYLQEIGSHGALPACFYVNIGTRVGAALLPSKSDYVLKNGDFVKWDVGCVYRHYWSDTARTIVVGRAKKRQREIFNAVLEGQQATLAAIRPGIKASELFEIAVKTVRRSGIPNFDRPHVGHGIGLEFYDHPSLRSAKDPTSPDLTLEENMVINIECPYYEIGFGAAQVEDTAVVTKTGYKVLTSLSRHLEHYY